MTSPDVARTILTLLAVVMLACSIPAVAVALTAETAPEVIVVTGRLPGPPLSGEIGRLVKKNRQIETVNASAIIEWDKGFGELASVVESWRDSLSRELELACVDHTLTSLETDLAAMKQRANAWAAGDIEALRAIKLEQTAESPSEALQRAGNAAIADGELSDIPKQMEAKWLSAVDGTLANHATSFAVLNINELLKQDGWLAKLRAKGYRVQEPDQ